MKKERTGPDARHSPILGGICWGLLVYILKVPFKFHPEWSLHLYPVRKACFSLISPLFLNILPRFLRFSLFPRYLWYFISRPFWILIADIGEIVQSRNLKVRIIVGVFLRFLAQVWHKDGNHQKFVRNLRLN